MAENNAILCLLDGEDNGKNKTDVRGQYLFKNEIQVEGGGEGALPAFQSEIRAAQKNAQAKNIWGMGSPDWIDELAEENSLSQEYLASVIDTYYGLWGAWEEGTNGMWGLDA